MHGGQAVGAAVVNGSAAVVRSVAAVVSAAVAAITSSAPVLAVFAAVAVVVAFIVSLFAWLIPASEMQLRPTPTPSVSITAPPPEMAGQNGYLPDDALGEIPWAPGHRIALSALPTLIEMNTAYKAVFGTDLSITDSYRDYAGQMEAYETMPDLAALPGTSNHGWGLAIDFGGGVNVFYSLQHVWMKANAAQYGWVHPRWAWLDGTRPEAWHWEYEGIG